ncbi:DUF5776 domain-containing protein, partial [uncultured Secundilactobacillus sp.]
ASTASSAASTAASSASLASSASSVATSVASGNPTNSGEKSAASVATSAASTAASAASTASSAAKEASSAAAKGDAAKVSSATSVALSAASTASSAASVASSAASVANSLRANGVVANGGVGTYTTPNASTTTAATSGATIEETLAPADKQNAYHQDLATNTILTKHGLYRYSGATFGKSHKLEYVPAGTVIHVVSIVHKGEMTRFVLSDGSFVTGLKSYSVFVKHLNYRDDHYGAGVWVVTNKRGINEYSGKTFSKSKKLRHVKVDTVLHVKRVVKSGSTYRLYLTNGRYVTANKHLVAKKTVKATYYVGKLHGKTVTVSNKRGIFKNKAANLGKATRSQYVGKGTKLNVKRIVRIGHKTRFELADGRYVTAYTKFVKVN